LLTRLAIVVVVVLALTACGEGKDDVQANTPSLTPGTSFVVPGAAALPLDSVRATSVDERRRLYVAVQERIAACMSRAGLPYVAPQFTDMPNPDGRKYGVVDRADAQTYGFKPSLEFLGGGDADSDPGNAPADPAIRLAWERALLGDGSEQEEVKTSNGTVVGKLNGSGCAAEAEREILGDRAEVEALRIELEDIAIRAYERSRQDEGVRAAIAAWSNCMNEAGYEYSHPLEPLSAWSGDTATAEEKAAAVADVECKEQTDLVEVWSMAEGRIQLELLANSPHLLVRWGELREQALLRTEQQ